MLVNPYPYTNGSSLVTDRPFAARVTIDVLEGFQGGPYVVTEDNIIKRETYEMQKMIDPGDLSKERQVWHAYPGIYKFESNTYVNIPQGHVGFLSPTPEAFENGVQVQSPYLQPGFCGIIKGLITLSGGETFLQPGMALAELIMIKYSEGE